MCIKYDNSNLENSLHRLYQRRQFGIKPGLAPIQRMCELLENPEQKYGIIHIAGTNGKGSTAAITAAILKAAGVKTGLYTSPHLLKFNERIKINGTDISDNELAEILNICEDAAATLKKESGHEATFFETATLMAFEAFRRSEVRLAVIETGLGGRLDATNVVTPLVSIITPISLDHLAYLGTGLDDIAAEKGGIIKISRPVVVAPQADDAMRKLREIAADRQSRLINAADAVSISAVSEDLNEQKIRFETINGLSGTARLNLPGAHQRENLATAIAAIETLFGMLGIELTAETARAGIENTKWQGRCQLLQKNPPVIVDAAHNPAGAQALVKLLKKQGIRHAAVVLGVCSDKDANGIIRQLAEITRRMWLVPIAGERGMPPAKLLNLAQSFNLDAETADTPQLALDAAKKWIQSESLPLIITGSIFLIGEVLKKA